MDSRLWAVTVTWDKPAALTALLLVYMLAFLMDFMALTTTQVTCTTWPVLCPRNLNNLYCIMAAMKAMKAAKAMKAMVAMKTKKT